MTKNINFVSHKKSKVKLENGKPQLPSASALVEGEIAVNYAKDVETLSIKNESGSVVTFSSDNYYTEQKLGSGFTGSNSAKTVTDVIVENEETVSAALNDLQDTKCDLSAETEHYNVLNSGLTIVATAVAVINDKVSGKTDVSAFTEHTSNTNLHFSGSEKENLDALATNIAAISGITADKIDSWNAAAGQDLTQYYKKTETSGATELETAFSAKANLSDIPSVTGYADAVKYNNTTHYVEFYHGTTAGTKVFEYDASPFIIDGMVQNVEIKNVTSGESQVTCLVISFNTDAGKQDINIPISQIFDASNYYTTAQTDTKITEATSGKVDNTTYTAYTAATATEIGNKLATSDFNTYSGTVNTSLNSKASQSDLNTLSGTVTAHTADGDIHVTTSDKTKWNKIDDKADATAVTEAIDAAVSGKTNQSDFSAHTANTTMHITAAERTAWNAKSDFSGSYNDLTDKPTIPTSVSQLTNDTGYITSSALNGYATEDYVTAATSGKANTSTFNAHTASTVHMSTTEKTNLDSLATNIAAISGITSTKVSNWDGAVTNSHTHTNKSVLDGISSSDITNWNSKTSNVGTVTSVQIGLPTGLSAATTAITESGKFDVKFSNGYSIPTTLKQGQWDEAYTAKHSHDNKTVLDGITTAKTSSWDTAATSAHNHSNKSTLDAITASSAAINSLTGAVGTMAFQNTSSYSSATQVQTALGKKSDTGHTHVKADITDFPAINDGTFTISGNGASVVSTSANASANKGINIKSSTNVTITTGASEISIAATDTKYANGNFITITGSNNSINVTTGTTSSSVSRGDHNHDSVYTKITDSEAMEQTLAAAITDIDSRAADKEELKALVNDYQDFKLMYENRRERKRFTNRDDFVARLKMAAADQNLERYGLKVGDYYTTTNGGKTYNYVIAGLNTMKGTHSYRLTTDHVGIIVDTNDTHAWNVSGNTHQSTNTYSTGGTWTTGASAAGYANCDLHYYLTTTVLPYVEADLGSDNIKSHYKLYSTAVNTSGYNRYGSAGGCSSSWAWYANQKICALSEVQVYGSIVWSSSGYDTGEACRQLDVFRVYNMNEIFEGRYPWLRDVASASVACFVDACGRADTHPASYARYVAALILFA